MAWGKKATERREKRGVLLSNSTEVLDKVWQGWGGERSHCKRAFLLSSVNYCLSYLWASARRALK
jgi:hypothetical protein